MNCRTECQIVKPSEEARFRGYERYSLWGFLPIDIIINIFTINKIDLHDQLGSAERERKIIYMSLQQKLFQLCCPLHPHQTETRWQGKSSLT